MITLRRCVLLTAFAAMALMVVHLRAEQTRAAARALTLESRRIELRRELWLLQTEVARLKAPDRIHERVGWFDARLVAPGVDDPWERAGRYASNQSYE